MNKFKHILFVFVAIVLMAASCKKEVEEIDLLPPATQSGKNTFGCLVDDKAFLPKGRAFNPLPHQGFDLEVPTGDRWLCKIFGLRNVSEGLFEVRLHTDSLLLEEGKTYNLASGKGEVTGIYNRYTFSSSDDLYNTDGIAHTGQLHVTRFDRDARIISGTFWYDAVNSEGVVVKIREGRFDFKYI
jgi:hypothetical protein